MRRPILIFIIGVLFLSIAAFLLAWWATWHGVGLTADSVMYIGGARGLMAHKGYGMVSDDGWFGPLVTYMPGFPVLMAILGNADMDLLFAARLIEAGLFATNVALVATLIWRHTNRSIFAALLGGAIFGASPVALSIHTCAFSEPLFIALLLSSIGALASSMRTQKLSMTIAAGIFLGCAYLTRYAALAFIGSSILAILIFFPGSWKRRSTHVAMLLLVCALFVIPWMIRIHRLNVAAIGRPMAMHPITAQQLRFGFTTLFHWLAPPHLPWANLAWIAYAIAIAAGVLLLVKRQKSISAKSEQAQPQWLLRVIGVMLIVYPMFLIVSISFFDSQIPLDDRILSPLFALLVVGGVVAIKNASPPALRFGIAPIGIALLALYICGCSIEARKLHADSVGYASAQWQDSPTMAAIANIPPGVLIYSNAWDAVYLYTHRHTELLPPAPQAYRGQSSAAYAATIQSLADALKARRAVIVYFKHSRHTLSETELRELIGLRLIGHYEDGEIDTWQPKPASNHHQADRH